MKEIRKYYDSQSGEALGELIQGKGYLLYFENPDKGGHNQVSSIYYGYNEDLQRDVFISLNMNDSLAGGYHSLSEISCASNADSIKNWSLPFIATERIAKKYNKDQIKILEEKIKSAATKE